MRIKCCLTVRMNSLRNEARKKNVVSMTYKTVFYAALPHLFIVHVQDLWKRLMSVTRSSRKVANGEER